MNIQIVNLSVINIRELSKKEKLFGLNFKSWFVCLFITLPLANFSFLYSSVLFVVLVISFYVAEFFDEDITDIIFSSFSTKGINIYYA